MDIQAKQGHSDFNNYVSIQRWDSYYYQIKEVSRLYDVHTILLIGIGDSIVGNIFTNLGYKVTTFDFDKNHNPDIVGSVTEIDKIIKDKFDCIVCCQVLEHIPFCEFENIMNNFSKIATKNVIISLPYNFFKLFSAKVFLPLIHDVSIKCTIPKFWQLNYRLEKEGWGEHYYEIGVKGSKKKTIEKIMKKYFTIQKVFNPIENLYHYFYVLEVKNEK